MMSALSEEEDILKGYSLKVDDYIKSLNKSSLKLDQIT